MPFSVFHGARRAGLLLVALSPSLPAEPAAPAGIEWPVWGGDAGATHFSGLTDITPDNVASLEVAWTHRSGDHADGSGKTRATYFQATPLAVNDRLYYCTPFQRVFALDPDTGAELWRFDPRVKTLTGEGPYPLNCRGVTYWEDSAAPVGAFCGKRIFYGTSDSELVALDADTGRPCDDFGTDGRVDLRKDLDEPRAWAAYPTSPPLVMRDRVVINGFVADNLEVDAAPGVVRAFDARTGALAWAWNPVPPDWQPRPSARKSPWQAGVPNFGGGMATASGLFFIGASMDGYFRAYSSEDGRELWKTRLPYGGHAVPMTYRGKSGAQFVVIAAGGNALSRMGAELIAFRRPAEPR